MHSHTHRHTHAHIYTLTHTHTHTQHINAKRPFSHMHTHKITHPHALPHRFSFSCSLPPSFCCGTLPPCLSLSCSFSLTDTRTHTRTTTHAHAHSPCLSFSTAITQFTRMHHVTRMKESCHTWLAAYNEVMCCYILLHTAPRCSTLHYTATHCNTLYVRVMPHRAGGSTTKLWTVVNYNILYHTATHCTTLQHTEPRCNSLQHTATHCMNESDKTGPVAGP